MTTLLSPTPTTEPFYPSADGEPVAETYDHLYALLTVLEVLRQHLEGRQATVLGNQFLYYAQGYPRLRVAPDVMVIFDVAPGGRDNYKIWEEGQVPSVIFEMTSESTREHDQVFKRTLYEQLGVQEYWLFDPKGEWIPGQLQGYRLRGEQYEPIQDFCSQPLQLRLQVEGKLIGFYRQDTGEKLLVPDELAQALRQEVFARQQAEAEAEEERQRAEQERQRAEQERQRAEQERQRAEAAEAQVEQLRAKLRELGSELE
ncbi:Uma2 family endonuclease [Leptolyngbya sp. NK1-12]|uniref:Uma2 family endonuclease n=1 Tax=Leptolyngbya sp. NK1-12 TaxID=2547451 RepID=A0AA96WBA6_9CYAN|nr:Uma2 family endonuclease [Leptolyngbya sp. NK1-12]WNZ21889.1 Uma2 family endonuclease [Leptolyngbya sp. NK1-12]